jgi:glycosyltransferase EpsF
MDRSGVPVVLLNYHRNLNRENIQFDYAVEAEDRSYYDDEIEALGGKIHRIGQNRNGLKYYIRLAAAIRNGGYEIVQTHMNHRNSLILFVAFLCGVRRRISHSHNTYAPVGLIKKIIFKISTLFINIISTERFACSKAAGAWLYGKKKMEAGRVTVMNNAIDLGKFSFNPLVRESMRKELKVEDSVVIGHVGNFLPLKNHAFLIEVFYELIKTLPNAILVLVGDGGLKEKIINRVNELGIEEKVLFMGKRSDVADFYQAFDLFILPSLSEGLTLVLIESQASGLRCIASDTVSAESNPTGLVEFLSLESGAWEWASRANQAIKTKNPRTSMAKILTEKYFNIFKEATKLEQIYLMEKE